jgi:hypothetical protein
MLSKQLIKGALAWDIPNRVNFTELSHLDRWLGVYGKKLICMKRKGDIRHFVFLPATECAVKIIPRLLSMR